MNPKCTAEVMYPSASAGSPIAAARSPSTEVAANQSEVPCELREDDGGQDPYGALFRQRRRAMSAYGRVGYDSLCRGFLPAAGYQTKQGQ